MSKLNFVILSTVLFVADASASNFILTDTPSATPTPSGSAVTNLPTLATIIIDTVLPTDTPLPTGSPLPTDTLLPTDTPLPTGSPPPTGSPLPTGSPPPTGSPHPTDTETPMPSATPSGSDVTNLPTLATPPNQSYCVEKTKTVTVTVTQTPDQIVKPTLMTNDVPPIQTTPFIKIQTSGPDDFLNTTSGSESIVPAMSLLSFVFMIFFA